MVRPDWASVPENGLPPTIHLFNTKSNLIIIKVMKRFFSLSTIVAFACLLTLAPTDGRAQGGPAADQVYAALTPHHDAPTAPADPEEQLVIVGKITNPAGVLPGAVVILTATKKMAVTNANGEFEFVVPANTGPLRARVTYGGYADELITLNDGSAQATVNLANATVIVVARRQQLKAYLKTARKQVRRSLRQLHR